MVSHGKENQAKIWRYTHHVDGQAACERPQGPKPQYFLVHPHTSARLPAPGMVPHFDEEACGSPDVWGTRAQRSLSLFYVMWSDR
eukprot:6232908-Alexandrium_andersonii.AAC.1